MHKSYIVAIGIDLDITNQQELKQAYAKYTENNDDCPTLTSFIAKVIRTYFEAKMNQVQDGNLSFGVDNHMIFQRLIVDDFNVKAWGTNFKPL